MENIRKFIIEPSFQGVRLDAALSELLELSRSQIQRWIADDLVKVDDRVPKGSQKLKAGQVITVEIPPLKEAEPQADPQIELEVLYEDKDIIVINKPRGLVVHPGAGNTEATLVNGLLAHCDDLSGIGGVERPGIVHRLDKDTSGLMVVAKNDKAHLNLSEQFASRRVTKLYRAITFGVPPHWEGLIDQPIARHPTNRKCMAVRPQGKEAKTAYKVIKTYAQEYALLELHIFTGRTHQIRVHLSWLGCPIVGDLLYKPRPNVWNLQGQALHCGYLSFVHPVNGEIMKFSSDLPGELEAILADLNRRFNA